MQILILFVSVLVAFCAVLSALGFKGRVEVVGIDLGTTYSVVAVSEGRKVRLFEDPKRGKLTASTVAFLRGGEILVGEAARRHGVKDPAHVIFDAKRFIGRTFDDPTVAEQAGKYAFSVEPLKNDTTRVAFGLNVEGQPAQTTPELVGAEVVKALMRTVEADLGHQNVKRAVIAVPASFGPPQIAATGEAFKAAGLKVARVMPEPVAAAVAYGLHKKADIHHILVFDFGGGTLDVSILYVQKGSIEVVANGGDNDLGGTDLDACVAGNLTAQAALALGDEGLAAAATCDTAKPPCAPHVIVGLAEQLKVAVSGVESASRSCSACDGRAVPLELSRAAFEEACAPLFERAVATVQTTLDEGMLTRSDVDEVVLVGGTSRIPIMRERLRAHLQVPRLNTEIDPDVTVAVGAASILD